MNEHETNGFVANDDAVPETPAQSNEPPANGLPCPKCDRTFKNAFALRMHNVRTHGKGWDTGGNFRKGKGVPVKWSLSRRRKFNAKKAQNGTAPPQQITPNVHREPINPGVQFCPRCGCNIKNVAAAIAFGDRA